MLTIREFAEQQSSFVESLRDELVEMDWPDRPKTLTPDDLDYLARSGPVQREYLGYCLYRLADALLSLLPKWMIPLR